MAKFVATDFNITLNGGTVSPNVNSAELNLEAEDIETTAFGSSGWRTRIAGLKNASVTLNFMQDFGAGAIDELLYPLFGSFATVVIRPFSTSISATNPAYTAVALVTEYQPFASSTGDLAQFSVTWPITGEVERGTA
jgi:predicted secreted protein